MAYMSQENKKILAPAIKEVFKKYGVKATLAVRHHSELVANIKSSPIDFNLGDRKHITINVHCIKDNYQGVARDFLLELKAAMMIGNHDNSDPMTDYFNVGWYISINIGQWDKPYLNTQETNSTALDNLEAVPMAASHNTYGISHLPKGVGVEKQTWQDDFEWLVLNGLHKANGLELWAFHEANTVYELMDDGGEGLRDDWRDFLETLETGGTIAIEAQSDRSHAECRKLL